MKTAEILHLLEKRWKVFSFWGLKVSWRFGSKGKEFIRFKRVNGLKSYWIFNNLNRISYWINFSTSSPTRAINYSQDWFSPWGNFGVETFTKFPRRIVKGLLKNGTIFVHSSPHVYSLLVSIYANISCHLRPREASEPMYSFHIFNFSFLIIDVSFPLAPACQPFTDPKINSAKRKTLARSWNTPYHFEHTAFPSNNKQFT